MSIVTIPNRFGLRAGTAAALASRNEVLLLQEVCFETDTGRFKQGDAVTPWNSLPYIGVGKIDFSAISDGYVVAWNNGAGTLEFVPPGTGGGGAVVKYSKTETATTASNNSTSIPFDNTTPLVSEGDEYSALNHTHTMANSSSNLLARVTLPLVSGSGVIDLTFTLFIGSTLIAVKPITVTGSDYSMGLVLEGTVSAPGAGSHNFTTRWGRSSGTGYINRLSSFSDLYNGSLKAKIEVWELAP